MSNKDLSILVLVEPRSDVEWATLMDAVSERYCTVYGTVKVTIAPRSEWQQIQSMHEGDFDKVECITVEYPL